MRMSSTTLCLAAVGAAHLCMAQGKPLEPAQQLVREVVYNELHDHDAHGYWRYLIEQRLADGVRISQQVETTGGPITRVVTNNGRPLDASSRRLEQTRLERLMNSPSEQASHRQAYAEDEKRVGRILALLPDAFHFDEVGEEHGCRHLRFRPLPDYPVHSIEARIFRGISGDLWIDTHTKRMARLEGRLDVNIDFGMGMLGRVNKGSWFRMDRLQVSPTEWKTNLLEVHVSGRALLFKTIARETSETRSNFSALPATISVAQGAHLLELTDARTDSIVAATFTPASLQQRP